ncbi:hypothetical protein [Oscillatoria salina]|uniref:hypothetical protein n=1 Tax=Oscillatoria salina TaxID=331517 RepID=UPI0013BB6463|nr:hypothetical protein [Oscillatoria salina]MBZ8180327.1 hypothetical protein [Oscillatoria salina IIICB1]NET88641.1 hypothetical protein [Kamptonema sp. SIO1D9]
MKGSLTYLTTTGLTAALVVSGFLNLKFYNDIETTKSSWQNTQSQLVKTREKVDISEQEISKTKQEVEVLKVKAAKYLAAINNYQQQVNTLGICLEGVVNTMDRVPVQNEVNAYMTSFTVQQECEDAGGIIEAHRSVDTMSIAF